MTTQINGKTHEDFAKVREVFEHHFSDESEFKEIGAALTVFKDGVEVVNLWGGVADDEPNKAWEQDTLTHVFSSTKVFTAIAVAQLVSQGQLSYDDPVAKFWPEFAQNNKGTITVAQVLSHQSGVNSFEAPIEAADMENWEDVCDRLAKQQATFAPGEVTSYHAITLGHLAMEVVRRITGLMPADYVDKYIAVPLNADVSIGLDASKLDRVSKLFAPEMPKGGPPLDPKVAKAVANPLIIPGVTTASPSWTRCQIPAVNGYVSAVGLAKVWGAVANGGSLHGVELLSRSAIETMSQPLSGPDLFMGPGAWAAGVSRNRGNLGPLDTTFGNFGFGGSFGLADLQLGVGAAYTPNRLFPSLLQEPRGRALATAIIECAQQAAA